MSFATLLHALTHKHVSLRKNGAHIYLCSSWFGLGGVRAEVTIAGSTWEIVGGEKIAEWLTASKDATENYEYVAELQKLGAQFLGFQPNTKEE